MEKLEAVIFDFDGTIINTEKFYFEKMAEVAKEWFNLEFDAKEYVENVSGTTAEISRQYYKNKYNIEDYASYENEVRERLVKHFDEVETLPKVIETFEYLRNNDIRVAIATNGERKHIEDSLAYKGYGKYIDVIVTREDVERGKPYPDVFLGAAKKLGVDIKNCIAVEDSLTGVQSAVASGAYVILQTNNLTKLLDFSKVAYNEKDVDLLESVRRLHLGK